MLSWEKKFLLPFIPTNIFHNIIEESKQNINTIDEIDKTISINLIYVIYQVTQGALFSKYISSSIDFSLMVSIGCQNP